PGPVRPNAFVAITRSFLITPRFFSDRPSVSSDCPSEYTSAVSIKFTPESIDALISASASVCPCAPIFPQTPFPDPNVIVPRQIVDTCKPVFPRSLYCIPNTSKLSCLLPLDVPPSERFIPYPFDPKNYLHLIGLSHPDWPFMQPLRH